MSLGSFSGLCGSFDGNRNNDQTNGNGLIISSSQDFFRTRRVGTCTPYVTAEPNYSFCEAPPRPPQRPTLRNPDIEELTALLLLMRVGENDPRASYTFDPAAVSSQIQGNDVVAEFEHLCDTALRNSPAATICEEAGVDIGSYINSCLEDMLTQQDEELITGAIETMKEDCEFLAATNIDFFDQDEIGNLVPGQIQRAVMSILCPGDCSFNGVCNNGTCICNPGWSGLDCATNLTSVPVIENLVPFACDINGECPNLISVNSQQLLDNEGLGCHIDGSSQPSKFLASVQVECFMPPINHTGAQERIVPVRVSRVSGQWSAALPFIFYDGRCKECHADGTCTLRSDACAINNMCVGSGQRQSDNPCRSCQPEVSQTEFSPSFQNQECAPQLTNLDTLVTVAENAPKDFEIHSFRVTNPYTSETYSVSLNEEAQDVFAVVDRGNGNFVLVVADSLNYEAIPSYEVVVTAIGSASFLEHSMQITVELLNVNEPPTMDKKEYTASIEENSDAQSLFQASASDPDAKGVIDDETSRLFSKLTFSLTGFTSSNEAKLFTIDPKTGVVSTTGPLDFESQAEHVFQVRVTDGAGAFDVAVATVTVIDVNEAPEVVYISSAKVSESVQVGTRIGQLSTSDPDIGDTHTYRLLNATHMFTIDGDVLKTAKEFELFGKDLYVVVQIESTDAGGLSVVDAITIHIVNENSAPTDIYLYDILDTTSPLEVISERAPLDSVIGIFEVEDVDVADTHKITLIDDANGFFRVVGNVLVLNKQLNSQEQSMHTIRVIAKDSGEPPLSSPEKTFSFTIKDMPAVPTNIHFEPSLLVTQRTQPGTTIGIVRGDFTEPNDHLEFDVSSGCPFAIGQSNCVTVQSRTECTASVVISENIENKFYSCQVSATSKNTQRYGVAPVTIPLETQINGPVGITLTSSTIPRDSPVGAIVGLLEVVAPEGHSSFALALVSSTTSGLFELKTFSVEGEDRVAVVVTGPLSSVSNIRETLFISVVDSNGVKDTFPVDITISNEEMRLDFVEGTGSVLLADAVPGSEVARIALLHVARGDLEPNFKLASSASLFELQTTDEPTVVAIRVRGNADVDEATLISPFQVTVQFSSHLNLPVPAAIHGSFSIAIVEDDIEDDNLEITAPTFSSPITVPENAVSGRELVVLSSFDPENSGRFTYKIVSGNEAGLFFIDGSTGRIAVQLSPIVEESVPRDTTLDIVVSISDGTRTTLITIPFVIDSMQTTIGTSTQSSDNLLGDSKFQQVSQDSASSVPVVIGAVGGVLLLVAIILIVVVLKRRKDSNSETATPFDPSAFDNGLYFVVPSFASGIGHQPWYRAEGLREDCERELLNYSSIGNFLVRDYVTSPGWLMLHVKTGVNQVTEGKIRPQSNGYVLAGDPTCPECSNVTDLIDYLSSNASPIFGVVLTTEYSPTNMSMRRGWVHRQNLCAFTVTFCTLTFLIYAIIFKNIETKY